MGFMYKGQKIPTGGGTDVTAGDGLSKDGDTLSADNPVRGVYTQAEFSALTDEQKAKGTYFVDDGQGCGSCGEVYDGQERVIGTWFGRPLYRRVFEGTTGSGDGQHLVLSHILDSSNVCVKRVEGTIFDANGGVEHSGYLAVNDGHRFNLLYFAGNLYDNVGGKSFLARPFIAWLEYTKTTNPEVSA